jgi:hypothetical protein
MLPACWPAAARASTCEVAACAFELLVKQQSAVVSRRRHDVPLCCTLEVHTW